MNWLVLKHFLYRLIKGVPISILLPLIFMFIHRTVLNIGGSSVGILVHEDFYGGVLFLLFFLYFVLVPLPQNNSLKYLFLKGVALSTAVTYMIYIIGDGCRSESFHLNNFLAVIFFLVFITELSFSSYLKKKFK